ncbi:MAG: hypothetical protein GF341_00875 [candidate division Zixibacteria bacterium]|nr:hypothetical protein [candidate division Zixibacteria bacterium]
MSETVTRTVVRKIPIPGVESSAQVPEVSPRFPWLTVVIFAVGFALYFGTLLHVPSIPIMAMAISLLIIGVVLFIAAGLDRYEATAPTDVESSGKLDQVFEEPIVESPHQADRPEHVHPV